MSQTPTLPFAEDSPRRVQAVSEVVAAARFLLEDEFPRVWVRGEVSNFREFRGNWYFDLKDDAAVLHAVMFGGDNFKVPFRVENGMEVMACGRLSLFERKGDFQLVAAELEPAGRGAQQLAYEQLKKRLAAEGLFDPARKRPIPQLPRCIGVVMSQGTAAWRDVLRVWSRRHAGLHVILSPCRVQGEGASREIVAALRQLIRHGAADVIIVGRGGGSSEDLAAFNDEALAREIAASPVPVISAVGHEIDWSLSDHVADLRAATPSEAAELVARARLDLLDRTAGAHRRCRQALHRRVHDIRARLEHRGLHRRLERPSLALQAYRQRADAAALRIRRNARERLLECRSRVDVIGTRIDRASPAQRAARARAGMDRARARVVAAGAAHRHHARAARSTIAARLEALNPLSVLSRGFAVCEDDEGNVLRRASETREGAGVRVRLHQGELRCRVESTTRVATDENCPPDDPMLA